MHCLYQRPANPKTGALEWNSSYRAIFFYNGVNCRWLHHPDEVKVTKDMYRKNNGKEIPEYTQKEWDKNTP